jgi:pyruvate dehydrogenase E1 component alpha subunit
MPRKPVNAMDVEDVHIAVAEAAERARAGEGPTLLEFRTYRYKGHSMSDPGKYRTREEVATYKDQDPIQRVKARILEGGIATDEELKEIEAKIKQQVAESVEFAENSPWPDPSEIYRDVYVEADYPYIKE